jgi:hypothetical protein
MMEGRCVRAAEALPPRVVFTHLHQPRAEIVNDVST